MPIGSPDAPCSSEPHRDASHEVTDEPVQGKRVEQKKPPRTGVRGGFWVNPAITYFRAMHYHRRHLLDDRVRDGNGYGQVPMVTGNSGATRSAALEERGACR